jgi:cytochrome c-type biogenesis protein CcmH/NrfG
MDITPTQSMPMAGSPKDQPRVVAFCDKVIKWTLLALAALVPVFFLPFSLEVLELNKQMLLVIGAGIAGLAWVGKMLAERRFEYRKSVVNIIVLLYLGVYALSALFSKNVYMSLAGDFGQQMSGLTTIAAFVVLYFVVINNIRTAERMQELFLAIIIGGFLSGLYGLLQGLGVYLVPFGFAQAPSFNSVGTVGTLAVYQAFIVTLIGGLFLRHDWKSEGKTKLQRGLHIAQAVFMAVTAIIGLFIVAVVDFWPVTVSLLVASMLLIGFAFFHAKALKSMAGVLLPIGALIISLMLLVFRFPVALGYPAEVMPSMKASTQITMQSLREKPFFGSGPGTFLYDYAKHRSADVNATAFWNIRFDRASSQFLTMLATTGLLGALSWLAVALFLLWSAVTTLLKSEEQTWHLLIGMLATWFLLVLSKFLYSSTLSLEFATWMIMALLVVVHRKDFFQVKFDNSPRAAMTLSFIFILGIVFSISGLFVMVQRYAAESRYADAIRMDQVGGDVDQVIDNLAQATRLNTSNDVYVRNLGLALLAKANREAAMPLNLTRGEDETDEAFQARVQAAQADKLRRVATLASNAVNVSKQASDMNPNNVANWSVLASIYQNLFGVSDGADQWAASSYESAIELEPANPSLHNELGKVYLYQADLKAQEAAAEEGEEEKANLEKERDDLYAKAADSFQKALDNKADFAPAHFFLGVALDRQGKLKEAIQKMEDVLAFSPRDVGVGFQLALLYYRDDRKDDAINLMAGVVRLSPQYSNARWYLASMLEEQGELEAAVAQLEIVQSLNEGNEAVAAKVADLKAQISGEAPADGEAPAEGEELPAPVEVPVENPNAPNVTP